LNRQLIKVTQKPDEGPQADIPAVCRGWVTYRLFDCTPKGERSLARRSALALYRDHTEFELWGTVMVLGIQRGSEPGFKHKQIKKLRSSGFEAQPGRYRPQSKSSRLNMWPWGRFDTYLGTPIKQPLPDTSIDASICVESMAMNTLFRSACSSAHALPKANEKAPTSSLESPSPSPFHSGVTSSARSPYAANFPNVKPMGIHRGKASKQAPCNCESLWQGITTYSQILPWMLRVRLCLVGAIFKCNYPK
jgi:hypothetical protein